MIKNKKTAFVESNFLIFDKIKNPISSGKQVISEIFFDEENNLKLIDYPTYHVEISISCLIEPLNNDRVIALLDGDTFFILHILSRKMQSAITLNSKTELRLNAPIISIFGEKSIKLSTEYYSLLSMQSKFVSDISYQIVNELFIKANNSFKQINNIDSTKADHISQNAKNSFVINGDIGLLTTSSIFKMDGAQVHMG